MANVLLQLFGGGWREQTADVVVDGQRIEATLGSGSIDNEAEAERVAVGQLALYADQTRSDQITLSPEGPNDTPFLSHFPGQTVTTDDGEVLVESVSLSRDREGYVTYAAELFGHIDEPAERVGNIGRKMTPGTFDGISRVAQPLQPPPSLPTFKPRERQACCQWAANLHGGSSEPIGAGGGSQSIELASAMSGIGGELYPSETGPVGVLPAGVVNHHGFVRCVFDGVPTLGAVTIFGGGGPDGVNPAPYGGRVSGLGFPRLAEDVVWWAGATLADDDWTPSITILNTTDVDMTLAVVDGHYFGGCPCQHGTTTAGS